MFQIDILKISSLNIANIDVMRNSMIIEEIVYFIISLNEKVFRKIFLLDKMIYD